VTEPSTTRFLPVYAAVLAGRATDLNRLLSSCNFVAAKNRISLNSSLSTHSVCHTHSMFGDRSFAAAGPRTWNNLPIHLRDSELSLEQFRRSLKTHLYKHIFGYWQLQRRVIVFFVRWAQIDLLTYLLTYLQQVGVTV